MTLYRSLLTLIVALLGQVESLFAVLEFAVCGEYVGPGAIPVLKLISVAERLLMLDEMRLVCMYVCLSVCLYVCMYVCIYVHTRTYIYIHTHTHTSLHTHL